MQAKRIHGEIRIGTHVLPFSGITEVQTKDRTPPLIKAENAWETGWLS